MPMPVFDEISTQEVWPPHCSTFTPCSASWARMRSGFAVSRSHLVIATTIGTLADFACSIDSIVCGITIESAATTRTMTSVICEPRARMAEKASWPGVSRKVTMPLAVCTR